MDYILKIPAACGDIVPLVRAAEEMARHAATAYGATPFHKPAYVGQLPDHIRHLLNEARDGRLAVCSQVGQQGTVERIIKDAYTAGNRIEISRYVNHPDFEKLRLDHPDAYKEKDGCWSWDFASVGVDLGPTCVDADQSTIGYLHVKLHRLNEWGKPNGDRFQIVSDGIEWADERGLMEATTRPAPPVADTAPLAKNASEVATAELATVVVETPPLPKVPKPRKTWRSESWGYVVDVYRLGSFRTAEVFYKALLNKADSSDSPFIKSNGELFLKGIGKSVAKKTIENNLLEIKKEAFASKL